MIKHYFVIILSLVFINSCGQTSKSWKDIDYAGDGKDYHLMDIYPPETNKQTSPAVIVIYGSAWFGNNLKGADLKTIGQKLLNAGFAVVMPNHRASSDSVFPAQINDIKAVIRFIRANASQYHIDTSFIGITGSSSGGHLAAMAGTSGFVKNHTAGTAVAYIEGNVGLYNGISSSVDAVVDWFGPVDFPVMDSCGSTMSHNSAGSPESKLIGGPIQDNPDKCALTSPLTYIDPSDPPFLIIHGDKDPLVPHCQSEILHEALQKAGVSSQLVLIPGGLHGPGVHEEKYLNMMVDFFINQLCNK